MCSWTPPGITILYSCTFYREAIIADHDQQMHDLKDVMYAMELRFNEREAESQSDFQGLVDELKNKVCDQNPKLVLCFMLGFLEPGRNSCSKCSAEIGSR